MNHRFLIWIGLILTVVLVAGASYFISQSAFKSLPIGQKTVATTTTSTDNEDAQFFTLPSNDRNQWLAKAVFGGEYQTVLNVTQSGIDHHRDLIWDDIDFWIHRGVAYYQLGNCAQSGAAFYHVLMREPKNEMATEMMQRIIKDQCKTTFDFSIKGQNL
jgi:hypothetical protein